MPNWCENIVTFSGDIDELRSRLENPVKIIRQGSLLTLSFDQPPWEYGDEFESEVVPGGSAMSRTLVDIDKDATDMHWMVNALGTKWDFDIDLQMSERNIISGYFNSAWSPPEGWFLYVCNHYNVEGKLSFGEGGNDFGGILEVSSEDIKRYSSDYCSWAQLNDDSAEAFLASLIGAEDEYPEYIEDMKKKASRWPKTWEEYMDRFFCGSSQK